MLFPSFILCCPLLCCPTRWRGTTRRVCVCGISPVISSWTSWIGTASTLMLAYNIMPTKRGFSEMLKATLFWLEEAWGIFQVNSVQIRLSAVTCKGTFLPAQEVCSERAAMDIVKSSSWKGREAARASSAWVDEGRGGSMWESPIMESNSGRKRSWLLKHFLGQGWRNSDIWHKPSLK